MWQVEVVGEPLQRRTEAVGATFDDGAFDELALTAVALPKLVRGWPREPMR